MNTINEINEFPENHNKTKTKIAFNNFIEGSQMDDSMDIPWMSKNLQQAMFHRCSINIVLEKNLYENGGIMFSVSSPAKLSYWCPGR